MSEHPTYPFAKGHGTRNDFVILPDADGTRHADLDPARVQALTDRRAGIGGDGILRVVRTAATDDPDAVAARDAAEWFMDYRNADGSVAEMCGNGIRVFVRWLVDHEGVDPSAPVAVATRAGVLSVRVDDDGRVSAEVGTPTLLPASQVTVADTEVTWPTTGVDMGNPHAVAFVDDLAEAGSLLAGPAYDRALYPDGVNVEFVVRRGERHVAMRVHERGSGETQSCGTGAAAVMVASALADGAVPADGTPPGEPVVYRVDVPGGELDLTWTPQGTVVLTGPAEIVAEGVSAL
ncbi:diaminopimelate epimerase [Nocardioides sp. ChNu-153]|uniref:diaminopimelate epimerase n=1 Tax=unclassified Nocardioides TaxID=2615069 RepID=UPI002405AA3C|nr:MULTISPECIES: diaminopimelate epimerase [unclassified Nocardioides]MDN7122361.1 diaminopimelate epimerase [Nocardioides sp. ChNu-153]